VSARRFSIEWQEAHRKYRIPDSVLVALVDGGLPVRRVGDRISFDRHDLLNTSIHLGIGPLARAARRTWPGALATQPGESVTYRLGYQAGCPGPEHDEPCEFRLTLPGPTSRTVTATADTGLRWEIETPAAVAGQAVVPDALGARIGDLAELEFMRLPPTLQRNLGFIRHSGLADCIGASMIIVERAQAVGATARQAFGVIAAPPYANLHYWAELRVDDAWVPVDPVLVGAMTRWGALDASEWTPYRSIGSMLVRFADHPVRLAEHNGCEVPVALPSRRVTPNR
jgi:hypothetical protein